MPQEERLTTKEFWTHENPTFQFQRHEGHAIYDLIRKYIPANENGSCLEIGSFPGPFLSFFGDLGYTLNGVDFHEKNEIELTAWLRSQGYKTDEFKTIDFFEYSTPRKFDVVASFGFIEHFVNYKDVILQHADLVNENGYLVITTPNFGEGYKNGFIKLMIKRIWPFIILKACSPKYGLHYWPKMDLK